MYTQTEPAADDSAIEQTFATPLHAVEGAKLAFLSTIEEMKAGERPVDLDYLFRLAEFVFDAHKSS